MGKWDQPSFTACISEQHLRGNMCDHLEIPCTLLSRRKESDILATIGKAGKNYWLELRRAA